MTRAAPSLPPKYDAVAMAAVEDPYPEYRRLRQESDLCRGGPAQWVVTRHADVAALVRDERLGAEFDAAYHEIALGGGDLGEFFGHVMLNRDPPAHTILRELLAREFTTRRVRERGERIDALVADLLRPALETGRIDVVPDLAEKLPIRVLADFVGMSSEDLDTVRDPARLLSQAFATYLPEQARAETVGALRWMRERVAALFEEKERHPQDDVVTRLCAADPAEVTRQALVDNIVFLLFAGFTTTTDLLGNGLKALADRPDQLDLLRRDPELAPKAVEELLRFDAPVQVKSRVAHAPLTVRGRSIRPGRVLVLHLGAANHDEERFERPDVLDITRSPNPHLSFGGGGIHVCLGAALARAEGASVLRFLARHVERLEPDGPSVRRHIPNFRSLLSLPLSVTPTLLEETPC